MQYIRTPGPRQSATRKPSGHFTRSVCDHSAWHWKWRLVVSWGLNYISQWPCSSIFEALFPGYHTFLPSITQLAITPTQQMSTCEVSEHWTWRNCAPMRSTTSRDAISKNGVPGKPFYLESSKAPHRHQVDLKELRSVKTQRWSQFEV